MRRACAGRSHLKHPLQRFQGFQVELVVYRLLLARGHGPRRPAAQRNALRGAALICFALIRQLWGGKF